MLTEKPPTIDKIQEAYKINLEYVLEEVEKLLPDLVGKTVISSDHGELLGERLTPLPFRKFDHPEGYHVDELLRVPWDIHESEQRKEIVSEPPNERNKIEKTDIEENLRDLGYIV